MCFLSEIIVTQCVYFDAQINLRQVIDRLTIREDSGEPRSAHSAVKPKRLIPTMVAKAFTNTQAENCS